MTMKHFGKWKGNASLILKSITLQNNFFETVGIDADVTNCTFVGCKLKFQGNIFKELTRDGSYQMKATTNQLTIFDSKFLVVKRGLPISVHISDGHVNITNTHFEKASQYTPVLLITNGSKIVLNNCTFENNRIRKEGKQNNAAVVIYGSSAIVIRSVFTNNVGHSGIIYGYGNTDINVTDCVFEGNRASTGGVFFVSNNVIMNIESSLFVKNIAPNFGGAIYASQNTSLRISDCNFTQNRAILANGGAIAMSFGTRTHIFTSTFLQNSAGNAGGALHFADNNSLHVENTNFSHNFAESKTGVIRMDRGGVMLFKHCVFRNNTAVIATFENVTVQILNCVFDSNRSGFSGLLEGVKSVHFFINNTIFTRNTADDSSLINIGSGCTLRVESSHIYSNGNTSRSLFSGHYHSDLRFTNCTFSDHFLPADPLLVISGSSLTLLNCTFENNVQQNEGGIVGSDSKSSISVTSCRFVGNKASQGGIFYLQSGSKLTVNSSIFLHNTAGDASIAYLARSSAFFFKTYVNNCTSSRYGGNILAFDSQITIRQCEFSFGAAVEGGCFFLKENTNLAAYDSIFENNTAQKGAVIFKYGHGNVSLENCTLKDNVGTFRGIIHQYNTNYLRLSKSSYLFDHHRQKTACITFEIDSDQIQNFRNELYTYDLTINSGRRTINSKTDKNFINTAKQHGMIYGLRLWTETPYASCKC